METTSNKTSIESLLIQVSQVVKKYEEIAAITGENFNIFRILKFSTNEVRTHSAFLCELLNPKGDHGMKSKFLKIFIEQQKLRFIDNKLSEYLNSFEIETSETTQEFYIGPVDYKAATGGRIDILVSNSHRQAILFENKINAGDEDVQIVRYHNAFKNAPIFYLTLYGTLPSDKSVSLSSDLNENVIKLENEKHYYCISYSVDILEWLQKCKKESVNHPLLRETITQYINLIKYLTKQTSFMEKKNEIVDLLVSSERSLNSFFELNSSNLMLDVKRALLAKFKMQITEIAEKLNLELHWDNNYGFGEDSDCTLKLKDSNSGYIIDFGFCIYFNQLVFGILKENKNYLDSHRTTAVEYMKRDGLVNVVTGGFANWLWVDYFDYPNWNQNEPWLKILDSSLATMFEGHFKNLIGLIKRLEED